MTNNIPSWPKSAVISSLLLCAVPEISRASSIALDFDSPVISGQIGLATYAEKGFTLTPIGPIATSSPFHLRRNGGGEPGFPDPGSGYVQLLFGDSLLLTQDNGSAFSPINVDLAEYSDSFATSIPITFIGYFESGGSVSTTFVTDGLIDGTGPGSDFETFFFPSSFALITRLEVAEIDDPASAFSLDNLSINAVPEPSVLTLSAAASLLILIRRR